MMEDENIHDYYVNILDIANSFDSLGEKFFDEKLVRKILRSLPKRFDMKVIAIEEAQDISSMKVDELIGSPQTFELASGYKKKNISFVSNTDEEDVQCERDTDEIILDSIIHLGREFNKVLEMIYKKSRPNVQNISFDISRNNESQRRGRNDENSKHVTTLTGRCESDTESCDEELTYEEICKLLKKQKKTISQLHAEKSDHLAKIFELNDEVIQLNSQLKHLIKAG